jgi:hypothetical protein
MFFMGAFVFVAAVSNPNLFLWSFLSKKPVNRVIFGILFVNQYVLAFVLGPFIRDRSLPTDKIGIEFYVMLAGVLATLLFLIVNATNKDLRAK